MTKTEAYENERDRGSAWVVIAEVFENIAVRQQQLRDLEGERLGIHLGIVNGDLQVHMAEVTAAKTLLNVQRFADRVPDAVNPDLVVKTCRVNHQRFAFPMPHRV